MSYKAYKCFLTSLTSTGLKLENLKPEHIPGERKNILKLRILIDQMGIEDRWWRSKLDRAISLDLQGFTSTELRREPATIRSKIIMYS